MHHGVGDLSGERCCSAEYGMSQKQTRNRPETEN